MNLSKKIISLAVASMVGAAGYAVAQQTDSSTTSTTTRDETRSGTSNPNVPTAEVSGATGESGGNPTTGGTSDMNRTKSRSGAYNPNAPSGEVSGATGASDSSGNMNSTSGSTTGERAARADRN